MTDSQAAILAAAVSLLGSIIMGLVAHGWRSDLATLRAEMRAQIAESVNTFYLQINGSYVKKDLYVELVRRMDSLEQRVNDGE